MKNTIIGLDLDQEYAQISYYSERSGEPETVSIAQNQDKYLIPVPEGMWKEAGSGKSIQLTEFFKTCMSFFNPVPLMTNVYMMITMREVKDTQITWVRQACRELGMPAENLFLQSYRESFFYYVLNQKKELWNHTCALFEYTDDRITSWMLQIDQRTKPALVRVLPGETAVMGDGAGMDPEAWNRKKDETFLELVQTTFREKMVSSTFLIGENFDKDWAVDSLRYLCRKRHVFQGRNLYTKGACYAMYRKLHMGKNLDAYLYQSEDTVENNISIQVDVRRQQTDYMLISAGNSWYEAKCDCEILLKEGKDLVLYARSMHGGDTVGFTIALSGLADRPPGTTRLRLHLEYESPVICRVTVRDLGFGEFFPASGLSWESRLNLES